MQERDAVLWSGIVQSVRAGAANDLQAQQKMLATVDRVAEVRAYFQRVCDGPAVACGPVQELHRLYAAYFDCLHEAYAVLNAATNPSDARIYGQKLSEAEKLRARAEAEEGRLRAWLASSAR